LSVALYAGIVLTTNFTMILIVCLITGLGAALTAPALSAFFLDITAEKYRSRVVGIKESALALGGVAGPLLVTIATRFLDSTGIFALAGVLVLLSGLLAAILLKEPEHLQEQVMDSSWQVSSRRSLAAQSAMRGIVLQAQAARRELSPQNWLKSWQEARSGRRQETD
jgi:MFS family permease